MPHVSQFRRSSLAMPMPTSPMMKRSMPSPPKKNRDDDDRSRIVQGHGIKIGRGGIGQRGEPLAERIRRIGRDLIPDIVHHLHDVHFRHFSYSPGKRFSFLYYNKIRHDLQRFSAFLREEESRNVFAPADERQGDCSANGARGLRTAKKKAPDASDALKLDAATTYPPGG